MSLSVFLIYGTQKLISINNLSGNKKGNLRDGHGKINKDNNTTPAGQYDAWLYNSVRSLACCLFWKLKLYVIFIYKSLTGGCKNTA